MLKKKKTVEESKDEVIKIKKGFSKTKGLLIGVSVIVLLIAVFILKGVMSNKLNIYDTLSTILTSRLGSFTYTLDVRTSEFIEGESNTTQLSEMTEMDLNNLDSADKEAETPAPSDKSIADQSEDEEETQGQTNKYVIENKEWGNSEDIKVTDWEYPNYKVVFEGCTTSLEPLVTSFDVTISTAYFADKFTDVTCIDDKYYINVEQMRYWLTHSCDEYLNKVGQKIPEGSKYITIPASDFTKISRYAEDGELDFAVVKGLNSVYTQKVNLVDGILDSIIDKSAGLSADSEVCNLKLTDDNATSILYNVKNLVNNSGDFYDSYIDSLANEGIYENEDNYNQAKREKDNILSALEDLRLYINTVDLNTMNLALEGSSREYKNSQNNDALEASLHFTFNTDKTAYNIQFTAMRSGNATDIVKPDGTIAEGSKNIDIWSTVNSVKDYFNILGVAPSKKLEFNPESTTASIQDSFIKFVNDIGTADFYLTRNNFQTFIEKYANYVETPESTQEEKTNAKVVSDFMSAVNNVTGGIVKTVVEESEEEVEQFKLVETSVEGLDAKFVFNSSESKPRLGIVDATFVNNTKKDITISLTNFSLHSLLSSIYPANNEVMLRNYDNNWDIENLQTEIVIESGAAVNTKLYCITGENEGYLDLWYGETQLGEVVAY